MKIRSASVAFALAVSTAVSGCATTSGSYGGGTAMDRAIRNCMMSIGAGAILGAVIGNNTGSGSAGRGAAIGAVAGAGACAVFIAVANEQDRARLRELELAALNSGSTQYQTFNSTQGRQVAVTTQIQEAPVRARQDAAQQYTACRYSSQTVDVAGSGQASAGNQLWCRLETGDWEPVAG